MDFSLPKIYPITDVSITNLSHLEQVKRLIAGGAELIQLRDKHSSAQDFYESAQAVMEFVKGKNVKIIINDRVDIALAVKADGVHLGQDDLPPPAARQIMGNNALIGFSTHNVIQATEAVKLPLNYIALGPIFQTSTKENPDKTVGLEGINEVRRVIGNFPLTAIGGIDLKHSRSVLSAGANSLALISQILKSPENITQITNTFVKQVEKF